MSDPSQRPAGERTSVVRSGLGGTNEHGAVIPPIHLTSTYELGGLEGDSSYDYTRTANPTRDALSRALAELEGGVGATVTSSGMAALNLVFQLLQPSDLLVAPRNSYGGTHRLLTALDGRGAFRVRFIDQTNEAALREAFAEKPRMILVETPSNPLLGITDLDAVSRLCRATGTLMVADNTFLSPVWQSPIAHGADLVVHSTTKYLNGHSDMVGGCVITADASLHEELAWWANCTGVTGAPFDSYLTHRGLRTLHARARLHEENTDAVVAALDNHPAVAKVYYPGLRTHPGHEIAVRQQRGFGAMVSFELKGGDEAVGAFVPSLRHFFLAESLGGVESLICHPATMTHDAMGPEARSAAGISDSLLRLSIGIEDTYDLVNDLTSSLDLLATSPMRIGTMTSSEPAATSRPAR